MSALDAAFLRLESGESSLHIASVAVFAGPAPTPDEVAALYAARLPLLPRHRQRMREVPLRLGRTVWVDDPTFDLAEHLQLRTVERPGGTAQLCALVGELMSDHLDRSRPLWRSWLVDGLADGRWALVNAVHHCMVDGIAGTDLLTRMLDTSAQTAEPIADEWEPGPEPGPLALLGAAVGSTLGAIPHHPARLLRAAAGSALRPRETASAVMARAHGLLGFAALARPAPQSSLAGRLGPARRWVVARASMDDIRAVRHGLGGTVNDVVLTAITCGYRDLLLARGETPAAHVVRTLVPVSVRGTGDRPAEGNRVSAMVADLPVQVSDSLERYESMRMELDRLKHSGEAQAGELIVDLAGVTPALLVNTGLSAAFRLPQRALVTVTTNVPGPQVPLYALGRRLLEVYPYVPIADRVRIGVAVTSYAGAITFGVTADRASTGDLAVLSGGIENGLRELVTLAEAG